MLTDEQLKIILDMITKAPDSQLSESMTEFVETLKDKPKDYVIAGLCYVLDMSQHCALASSFMLSFLSKIFNDLGGDRSKRKEYANILPKSCKDFYDKVGV